MTGEDDVAELERLENELKELTELEKKSDYGSPPPISKDTVFKFFNKILDSKDSTKVGNLSLQELGSLRLSVRSYQEIALYADAEGLDKVAKYFKDKAEIIARTSMSKKGFWSQLFVTQIKKEQKIKDKEPKKKFLFGGKKEEESE